MSEGQAVRILVVDDEPMIAEMIVDMLTDANYAVVGPYLRLGEKRCRPPRRRFATLRSWT